MTLPAWLRRSLAAAGAVACLSSTTWAQDAASESAGADDTAGKLESMTEQLQTLVADVDKLKKFKFSGYVQARWEHAEHQNDSVRVRAGVVTPANLERFHIRRARLKMTYDSSPLSQAVVYIDGGADRTVRLLEAYLTLMDPWTVDHRHQAWIGQFNVPFGYEVERSSSARELPERSRAENVLFPGERDRGIKIHNPWTSWLETTVGVFNGSGVNHPNFPTTDPTSKKDVTGRVRVSQGTIDVGASAYLGKELTPLTGPDVETDKTRFGGEAQLYFTTPSLGGGSIKGEYYTGENLNADSVTVLVPAPASGAPTLLRAGADPSHLATDFDGGYVMFVQNLGEKLQFAARWDWFDPNTDVDHDRFERTNLGLNWFWDGFTRITAAYEIPKTERLVGGSWVDPKDNAWTIQFQHRF
jgi:hypothetical protein